ncbi:MAG: NB-ARC domain-containing protein, partial [Chloroflexota bacterium]
MTAEASFSQQLDKHITDSGYSISQVARLADISKRTLANWVAGHVQKPRDAEAVLRLCQSLTLSPVQTQHLFSLAGLPAPSSLISDIPFHIGPDLPYFVGRQPEIEAITSDVKTGKLPFAYAIIGMAGVGKTTLAWHLAHRLQSYFPDGVLWAQDVAQANTIETALTSFALSFGVDVSELPDLDSKQRVWHTMMRGKQAIIILENAEQFADLAPLLPAQGSNLVLITTRQQGFGTMDGAHAVNLSCFDTEAWQIVEHFLPAERIRAEHADLQALIDAVGGLPLALSITLSRLSTEPHWTVAQFNQRLARIDSLATDSVSVQSAFALTYERLPELTRMVFSVLGMFDRDTISLDALASVLDLPLDDTLAELTLLYRASLVQYNKADTYRLHPLLAQFARRTPPAENFQLRFINYYVSYIEAHYHDYDTLTAQLTNILRMIDIALAHNAIDALVDTLSMFFSFLENRGLLRRIDTQMKRLYEQVQMHDDTKQKAIVAYYYGRLERRLGHWQHGETLTRESLTLSTANQQIRVMLLCHNSLGIHAQQAGQLDDALT